jgi:hypothetical protein
VNFQAKENLRLPRLLIVSRSHNPLRGADRINADSGGATEIVQKRNRKSAPDVVLSMRVFDACEAVARL